MTDFHTIWRDQCEAARDIREAFGLQKALGYLIGEKLLNFVGAADQDPDFAAELSAFLAEIRSIFEPSEIRAYLDKVPRVGSLGHILSDADYEEFRDAGAVEEDPVEWAREILLVERVKKMLLPDKS
ncbi:MAG: hypothetical protein ACRD1X_07950 [Vicinamibacteria bacterium]